MSDWILEARGLARSYRDGELEVEVLRGVDFRLAAGSQVAIVGASGSGKSTLLNLLGGLDRPSSGAVLMRGEDLARLGEPRLCALRNRSLGFVYQFHHLLPEFSALENVAMPALIGRVAPARARQRAAEMLAAVGLAGRLRHRPAQLSGGERQRVAIARALVMRPACVLMDEPTGNLDPAAALQVLELLAELRRQTSAGVVLVTHDRDIAGRMDARYHLRDGLLEPGA